MPSKRYSSAGKGFAMPVCLLITVLISLLAVTAYQTALSELRIGAALINARQAYGLAEYAVNSALRYVTVSPATLPSDSTPLVVPLTQPESTSQQIHAVITTKQQDKICPQYISGIRQHYEILATATSGQAGKRIHRQGFYVCRLHCAISLCPPLESKPVRTYWTIDE